ncbi:alpha-L-glutamate ligase [Microbacterium trichothecenolyticum]|uniref:Alpha-L-glutamate ligase n=1 Tax=Microbacterium ureisolvens TaxID=2781186 RepID=A0ABS7HUE7_9MICO|nr:MULTISPECIES: alpha-L-glutamate ligase [Microbacterium]MBW9108971.1 alpha-L-glutamate ligase [Microbacterium ureisolvens]MBW9119905.1 alpha-L-glutamate ligase [Microbacterium trichothecenolyticum]
MPVDHSGPVVHLLHDNPEWLRVFELAFADAGVPLRTWEWHEFPLTLDQAPPPGVYWSRLSASAHTRGRPHAKDSARALLGWLESWDRRVVGGSQVAELEVSKAAQHAALRRAGLDVPRTVAVADPTQLVPAAAGFAAPFIVKHNQGGKGLGVRRFDGVEELAVEIETGGIDPSPDGITLVQEYLTSRDGSITRAEFVDGRFVYAVRVDTSGGFELCPAEACDVPGTPAEQFTLRHDIGSTHPLVRAYERFLAAHRIEIAGIEFVETLDGRVVTYDVNTNTNYNPAVEHAAAEPATRRVARAFQRLLREAGSDSIRHAAQRVDNEVHNLATVSDQA